MVAKMAERMAVFFSKKEAYDYKEIKSYKYGFELLISTAMNFAGIILISYFTDTLLGAFLFLLAFIPIRLTAGGYHAKHHWSCILGFNFIYFISTMFIKSINKDYITNVALLSVILSSLMIIIFSPVESENKLLSEKKWKKQRDISILIASMNLALVLVSFYGTKTYVIQLGYYVSGSLMASILLAVPFIVKKR